MRACALPEGRILHVRMLSHPRLVRTAPAARRSSLIARGGIGFEDAAAGEQGSCSRGRRLGMNETGGSGNDGLGHAWTLSALVRLRLSAVTSMWDDR
eukprot:9473057-Pyramimonas_sp.AAC.1